MAKNNAQKRSTEKKDEVTVDNNNNDNSNNRIKKQKQQNITNTEDNNNNGNSNSNSNHSKVGTLTVSSVISDRITQISAQHWLSGDQSATNEYQSQLVHDLLYNDILNESNNNRDRTLALLELSHYLENYLWPHFKKQHNNNNSNKDSKDSNNNVNNDLIWSIIIMINEKAKEGISAFQLFENNNSNNNNNTDSSSSSFKSLFELVLRLPFNSNSNNNEIVKTNLLYQYIQFLIHCYQSLENPMVRAESLKIVSYPIWMNLSTGRLAEELQDISPQLQKKIMTMKKKYQKSAPLPSSNDYIYSNFLILLMKDFIVNRLEKITVNNKVGVVAHGSADDELIRYCELFVEFMIDLVNQITTRRFAYALLDDFHLLVRIKESAFSRSGHARVNNLHESLKILEFYLNFTIDNFSGQELPMDQVIQSHYFKIQNFQRLLFKSYPELKELALQNVSAVEDRANLVRQLEAVGVERLRELAVESGWLAEDSVDSKSFVISVVVNALRRHHYHKDALKSVPFYPSETELWNNEIGVLDNYRGERSLPLPKLNMQYLSLQDYLFRNYYLFKTEAAYELRADLEDSLRRLAPKLNDEGQTVCTGWSKMALPLINFRLIKVGQPLVGQSKPSKVVGVLNYSLANVKQQNVRDEWESLKEYDVLMLVSVRAKIGLSGKFDHSKPFATEFGVTAVRGCELIEICDEKGDRIENQMVTDSTNNNKKQPRGNMRQLKVLLDSNQYQLDLENSDNNNNNSSNSNNLNINHNSNNLNIAPDIYKSFNIIVRRKAKENNFKAIQETIVSLINDDNNLPEWLSNTFLGYPSDSSNNNAAGKAIDFQDTFISKQHLLDTYKDSSSSDNTVDFSKCVESPFKLTFNGENQLVAAESYQRLSNLSLNTFKVEESRRSNKIKFTGVQVDAIRRGSSEGLTLIVGPPGTGKTDVAVQIISNIYHNHPNQRTLIITHSNQALNQLFDKICQLDIDERHLLRLGHGHSQLESQSDFTRTGRIDYMLSLRIHRLALVDYLAKTLGVTADVGSTCETADHFYQHDIIPRWTVFQQQLNDHANSKISFPFNQYFQVNLFVDGKYSDADKSVAERCWRAIQQIFTELEECRAFELLKSPSDRFNYLLMKQSRIVAMTCTHAALKRNELVRLGFKDLRRLVVAMSRARLGLYIFCKRPFFNDCYETISVFHKFTESPDKLVLVPSETYPTERHSLDTPYQSLESSLKQQQQQQNNNIEPFIIENYLHMQQLVQSNLPQ
ncbi:intron-binding protein [Heterostelium album PN500]|uniref:Intron-binding protein n=1 Tax=Heterostelium pallidum (strain ATCC 26659 / Pp 5 / PN500) TaxID=670386 RepID=D3B0U2_HETP5|nr:intron-binding protein [Heterostelium album PN500]EFA84916.1 intron-binding protein [Heterostelium album PN500]|eukprot:XP_020437026.1 intron-binding protein [Heterostelium album PN500]